MAPPSVDDAKPEPGTSMPPTTSEEVKGVTLGTNPEHIFEFFDSVGKQPDWQTPQDWSFRSEEYETRRKKWANEALAAAGASAPMPKRRKSSTSASNTPRTSVTGTLGASALPAIVLDLGSHEIRVGFAGDMDPIVAIPSYYVRGRDDRGLLGNAMADELQDPSQSRWQKKKPFDGGVMYNRDHLEVLLDHAFWRLGVSGREEIDHDLFLTEPVLEPSHARSLLFDLFFESYAFPRVGTAVDPVVALCGLAWSDLRLPTSISTSAQDLTSSRKRPSVAGANAAAGRAQPSQSAIHAVVVHCGSERCHVVPVVRGKPEWSNSKRLDVGGRQAAEYFGQILGLHNSQWDSVFRPYVIDRLVRKHCVTALPTYDAAVQPWQNAAYVKDHELVFRIPYDTKEVDDPEQMKIRLEKRRAQGRRLQMGMLKKRKALLEERESDLQELQQLHDLHGIDLQDFRATLKQLGFRNKQALENAIADMETDVAKRKEGVDRLQAKVDSWERGEDGNDNSGGEGHGSGQNEAKAEGDAETNAVDLQGLWNQRDHLLAQRERRERLRQTTDTSRGTAESRKRLRLLAQQIKDRGGSSSAGGSMGGTAGVDFSGGDMGMDDDDDDGERPVVHHRRRRGGGGLSDDEDDGFGMDDDDWNVYRQMDPNAEDSEEEREEATLQDIEEQLRKHDPTFVKKEEAKEREEIEEQHRIYLRTERFLYAEAFFQPGLINVQQRGLADLVAFVLSKYQNSNTEEGKEIFQCMARNIVFTGGVSRIQGFVDRLLSEIGSELPSGVEPRVIRSEDLSLTTWRGASALAAAVQGRKTETETAAPGPLVAQAYASEAPFLSAEAFRAERDKAVARRAEGQSEAAAAAAASGLEGLDDIFREHALTNPKAEPW
eukprot:Clim_evm56s22 gene=Clim_evmTU56s22